MKTLIALSLVLIGFSASAQPTNISVNVDGVVYSCTPGGSVDNCASKAANLVNQFESCDRHMSADYCLKNFWPTYKSHNPSCLDEGASACVDYCQKHMSYDFCLNTCK